MNPHLSAIKRPMGRGIALLRERKLSMVFKHLLTGTILQLMGKIFYLVSFLRDVQNLRSRYQNLRLPNEDPCMILYGIKILSPWICFWWFYGMCYGIHHSQPFRRTCFGTFSSSIQHKQIPDLWETPQRLQFLLVSYTWMSRRKLVNGL